MRRLGDDEGMKSLHTRSVLGPGISEGSDNVNHEPYLHTQTPIMEYAVSSQTIHMLE